MIITPNPGDDYLKVIQNILAQNPETKFKVILPTVATCMRLQQIIVDNAPRKSALLPQIVPIINVGIESDNLYQIPNENIEPISRLEQKILLSNIIRENSSRNVEINQALELSTYVMKLFDELIDSKISIEDLSAKAIELDQDDIWHDLAQHWRHRSDFLKDIYTKWLQVQNSKGKIDFASFRQHMLKIEIDEASKGEYSHILAGIFPQNPSLEKLCEVISESSNSYFITPPFNPKDLDLSLAKEFKIHHHHPIANNVDKWKNPSQREVGATQKASINFEAAPNIYVESERITAKVKEWLELDPNAEIAIVTNNSNLMGLCSNRMDVENIKYANYSGFKLSETKTYEYFISIIDSISDEGEIDKEKLLILLKTKYLYSEENCNLELSLRKEGKLPENDLIKSLKQLKPNLKSHIEIASHLAPNLWKSYEGKVLGDFLYELLEIELPKNLTFAEYRDFIKSISFGIRYHKNFGSNNVFFMNLEDADLCSYQYIICADLNEDSMPGKLEIDPWMNSKMRENLGLRDKAEKMGIDWYHFKNLLHRKYLYFTRSEKKNGTETHASRFLRELEIGEGLNVT